MEEYREEEVAKQSFWSPDTPAKPRLRNVFARRRTLKKDLGDNYSPITDSQSELGASAPSHSEESKEFDSPIENCVAIGDFFDLCKFDDAIGSEGYVYIDSEDPERRSFLDAKLAAKRVANCDNEALTSAEEELLLYFPRVLFDKTSTPMGDTFIPESLPQYDHIVYHTKNKDQKFNSTYSFSGSALRRFSNILKKTNILKRKQDGGTDTNERPQKKPKKRGYRPKVVGIGRPQKNFEVKTPKKSASSTLKNKDGSLNSKDVDYMASIDTEVENSKGNCINHNDYNVSLVEQRAPLLNVMNFPKERRKQRMMRRRWKLEKCSERVSKFIEEARKVKVGLIDKKSAKKSCLNTMVKGMADLIAALLSLNLNSTNEKRSQGLTGARNLVGLTSALVCNQFPRALVRVDADSQNPSKDYGILVPSQVGPHNGHGMLTTYKGKLSKRLEKLTEEERQQVLSWKIEMQDRVNEGQRNEGDKEWWENERKVFKTRFELFLSRLHIIQGDRKFSPWKGSVVDSVIGVFLTQNVSDHLSSSAFMTLTATFPCQSSFNQTNFEDINIGGSQESISNNINSILPVCNEELNEYEATNIGEDGNKESNDIDDDVLRSLSKSYKPLEVSNIHFQEKMDRVGFLEGSVVSSMVPYCSSQTTVYSDPPNDGTRLFAINMPLDTPERIVDTAMENPSPSEQNKKEPTLNGQQSHIKACGAKTNNRRRKNEKAIMQAKPDWEVYRKIYSSRERNVNHLDSADWEAVRLADVDDIAKAIVGRGQHNQLAVRIKKFLNQVYEDHKQIDLEWLRNAPPELVSKYLGDIVGIGLKSLECVRLLTLGHVAFPVDVNVGRIAIRLGWVPIRPLPGNLEMHVLQETPVLDNVQKYLWPRLKTLDPKTLYELHYQMITFGKVYCTKKNPNCEFCPMKNTCRYYASAFGRGNSSLPGVGKKPRSDTGNKPTQDTGKKPTQQSFPHAPRIMDIEALNQISQSFLEDNPEFKYQPNVCEPIIEEPSSPLPECTPPPECKIPDIEDLFRDDPNFIPTFNMGSLELPKEDAYFGEPQEVHMSTELVLSQANIPAPKLKEAERLRTKHFVYELPDTHPLLRMLQLETRDPDDPSPYSLAIWTPAETTNLSPPPVNGCDSQQCNGQEGCCSYNNLPKQSSDRVPGTILIPCRTATKGRFPLNGTYFQVNEVFCDHETSKHPINVPRKWLWNLRRQVAYFGTSTSTILKEVPMKEKAYCFWAGFICLRAFDRSTGLPAPLSPRFHVSTVVKKGNESKKTRTNDDHDDVVNGTVVDAAGGIS